MALISANTILTSLCLFHVTLAFFFLTSPGTIADQALVYIVGEAMGLSYVRSFESPSPSLAFLAVLLAVLGVSDLATLSLPEEVGLGYYWGSQAPLRFVLFLALSAYTFFFSPSSPLLYGGSSPLSEAASSSSSFLTHPSAHVRVPGYHPSAWGLDGLKNRVFFTFAFVEMISWFWVWVTLREERHDLAARRIPRRRSSHGGSW
ncbi:hypothetical protein VTK73DRAFT_10125 [Phialemonium thermophilum]|uniref:Increased loss of mitochondrial DNA protein 1 n=1 Tax=Phialemonium thermophilum TaxID=223376 RepID=A0ABR3VYF5_9PEZI